MAPAQLRCGYVYFKETRRTVPYLLVPRGATHSSKGRRHLLEQMQKRFNLDSAFSKGDVTGSLPNLILRVTPGANLSRPSDVGGNFPGFTSTPSRHSLTVMSPPTSRSESPDKKSVDQAKCLSKVISSVREHRGCFITSADRSPGVVSHGTAPSIPTAHPLYTASCGVLN